MMSDGAGKEDESIIVSQDGKKAAFDWRYLLTLIFASVLAGGAVIFWNTGGFSVFSAGGPKIVLINEPVIFQKLEKGVTRESPATAAREAVAVSRVIDGVVNRYRKAGYVVVLSDSLVVVPKRDDMTSVVEEMINKQLRQTHGAQ